LAFEHCAFWPQRHVSQLACFLAWKGKSDLMSVKSEKVPWRPGEGPFVGDAEPWPREQVGVGVGVGIWEWRTKGCQPTALLSPRWHCGWHGE
jgi:hypothetical protein